MFLDFSLEILCEVGGWNPLLQSTLHLGILFEILLNVISETFPE